jgi:hypothetical protein
MCTSYAGLEASCNPAAGICCDAGQELVCSSEDGTSKCVPSTTTISNCGDSNGDKLDDCSGFYYGCSLQDSPCADYDSFDITSPSTTYPLDVLANDSADPSCSISIRSGLDPDLASRLTAAGGTVYYRSPGSLETGGVAYTTSNPSVSLRGEGFQYRIACATGSTDWTNVLLPFLPALQAGGAARDTICRWDTQLRCRYTGAIIKYCKPTGFINYVGITVPNPPPAGAGGVFSMTLTSRWFLTLAASIGSTPFDLDDVVELPCKWLGAGNTTELSHFFLGVNADLGYGVAGGGNLYAVDQAGDGVDRKIFWKIITGKPGGIGIGAGAITCATEAGQNATIREAGTRPPTTY